MKVINTVCDIYSVYLIVNIGKILTPLFNSVCIKLEVLNRIESYFERH